MKPLLLGSETYNSNRWELLTFGNFNRTGKMIMNTITKYPD